MMRKSCLNVERDVTSFLYLRISVYYNVLLISPYRFVEHENKLPVTAVRMFCILPAIMICIRLIVDACGYMTPLLGHPYSRISACVPHCLYTKQAKSNSGLSENVECAKHRANQGSCSKMFLGRV